MHFTLLTQPVAICESHFFNWSATSYLAYSPFHRSFSPLLWTFSNDLLKRLKGLLKGIKLLKPQDHHSPWRLRVSNIKHSQLHHQAQLLSHPYHLTFHQLIPGMNTQALTWFTGKVQKSKRLNYNEEDCRLWCTICIKVGRLLSS